jgi:hypothetical protein
MTKMPGVTCRTRNEFACEGLDIFVRMLSYDSAVVSKATTIRTAVELSKAIGKTVRSQFLCALESFIKLLGEAEDRDELTEEDEKRRYFVNSILKDPEYYFEQLPRSMESAWLHSLSVYKDALSAQVPAGTKVSQPIIK